MSNYLLYTLLPHVKTGKSKGTELAIAISTELMYYTNILLLIADHILFFKGSLERMKTNNATFSTK